MFDWIKLIGGLRQFKQHGREDVCAVLGVHVSAYDMVPLGNMLRPAVAAT